MYKYSLYRLSISSERDATLPSDVYLFASNFQI